MEKIAIEDYAILCKLPLSGTEGVIAIEYHIQCKECGEGEIWDAECGECLPVCMDLIADLTSDIRQFLERN